MENDKKLDRLAFYAQYYNQKVLRYHNNTMHPVVDWNILDPTRNNMNHSWLELADLRNITDDHAIEVSLIVTDKFPSEMDPSVDNIKRWAHVYARNSSLISDYLRSQSYLLPFRQFTTDQILSMGWAKLKQQ